MFSEVFICPRGVCVCGGGGSVLRWVPPLGGLSLGGVNLSRGCHEGGEGSMKKEGAVKEGFHERGCHEGTPPVGQQAGGTHPTGMHSCYNCCGYMYNVNS